MKLKKINEDYVEREIIVPRITTQKEEYYLEKNDTPDEPNGLIKYGHNLAEFPIFSKNDKIKSYVAIEYVFNDKSDEYVKIIPSNDPDAISGKILQEFDERIFYGILKIYQTTENRRIITDYPYLLKVSGFKVNGNRLMRVKDSLERMNNCQITFNKVYYDAAAKAHGADFLKRTKRIRLITNLETITLAKFNEMNEKGKIQYAKFFKKHHRIQEIAIFSINEDLISNVEHKAFKYFDHDTLLEIENAVARKIFIMVTKWRYINKGKKITRKAKFLASRIPLSWKTKNISGTIRTLKNACEYLKSKEKIIDYKINGKGKDTSINIFFIDDYSHFFNQRIGTEATGQETLEITDIKKQKINHIPKNSPPIQNNSKEQSFINSVASYGIKPDLAQATIDQYGINGAASCRNYAIEKIKSGKIPNQAGYMATCLRDGIGINEKFVSADQIKKIKEAASCFKQCNGSCAAEWKNYKKNPNSACYNCKKFTDQRSQLFTR